MRLMRELRKNQKKKGMLALEAAMALLMVVMASYGVAATSAMEFSQMAASRTAKQAEQYAELEADYLRMVGFYHFDDGSTVYDEPHGRQNMRKIVGDEYGSEWESKVTHVNDITVDKFTSVKVARIDVYKTGDGDVPRFTLEVPLTSSSGDVPIGGIITWPSDTLPDWFNKDQYLECNGQSFNTSEYPHLAELYPDGRVPNYSGLFLRGSGSQSYSQVNGIVYDSNDIFTHTGGRPTNTTYSSGALGTVQGDALRNALSGGFGCNISIGGLQGTYYPYPEAGVWYPMTDDDGSFRTNVLRPFGDDTSYFNGIPFFFPTVPQHYRYTLNYSTSTDEDGNEHIDNIELVESRTPFEADEGVYTDCGIFNNAFSLEVGLPIANEIRPVNTAVRYFIRAR